MSKVKQQPVTSGTNGGIPTYMIESMLQIIVRQCTMREGQQQTQYMVVWCNAGETCMLVHPHPHYSKQAYCKCIYWNMPVQWSTIVPFNEYNFKLGMVYTYSIPVYCSGRHFQAQRATSGRVLHSAQPPQPIDVVHMHTDTLKHPKHDA